MADPPFAHDTDASDVFEGIADKIMERPETAAPAKEVASAEPAPTALETPAPSAGEKDEAAAPARAADGKFVADESHLVTIKGPWGEEKLDPRKPEDKARLVEYGQKGRNYNELLAKDDQRVAKRAQEQLFDNYRSLGLIGVNPDGTTFWTPKGLRVMQDGGPEQPAAPAPKADATAIPDVEVDRLVDRVMSSDDPAEAKKALNQAIALAGRKYGEEAAKTVVDAFKAEQAKERAAAEDQRRQAEANGSLVATVQKRFESEVGKHPIFATNPRLKASVKELVRQRTAALESSGVPGMEAFEQGLLEVDLYVKDIEGLKSQGVKETAAAAQAQRAAPPATGGGSAPASGSGKPVVNRRDPFGDEFQERVVNRMRAGAGR